MKDAFFWIDAKLRNLERIYEDKIETGFFSSVFHLYRKRLEDIKAVQAFLFEVDEITLDDLEDLKAREARIEKSIRENMAKRIKWLANGIDQSIEARKKAGGNGGEYTTAVILANAFNDIFRADEYGSF